VGRKAMVKHTVITPGASNREVINAWSYNQMGDVTAIIEGVGTEEQKTTRYGYQLGRKATITKPNGVNLYHKYDPMGRLEEYYADDNSFSYFYKYNKNSQLIEVNDLILKTVTTRKYNHNNNLEQEVLSNGLSTSYRYDRIDRPTHVTLPDNSGIELIYNAAQLKEVGRLSSANERVYVHRYLKYDLAGNLLEAEMINSLGPITFSYDLLGRNRKVSCSKWAQEIPDQGFDAVGNLLQFKTTNENGEIHSNFTYDDLYQVKSETGMADNEYASDSLYNRVSKNGLPHKVNAINQLKDDSETLYSYDKNGNLIGMKSDRAASTYVYDALDRLISVTKGSEQYRYTYDFLNRRLSKQLFEKNNESWKLKSTVRYLYQGQNEIGAVDESGKIFELRLLGLSRGAEIGGAIAHEIQGEVLAPIHDISGNVTCLVKGNREVFATYGYSAFGEVRSTGNAELNPWQYSSKRYDPETGFNNYGRRYYFAKIGRWLTPDPIGFEGGPNLYAYVLNNPLTHNDFYGLEAVSWTNNWGYSALKGLAQLPGHLVEICRHAMPIPSVSDLISKTGRFLRGEGFTLENSNPHSHRCRDSLGEKLANVRNLCINGVLTFGRDVGKFAQNISDSIGNAVVGSVYNASHGLLCDVLECAAQIIGIRTRSVDVMVDAIRAELEELGPNDALFIYAHSQGGLITHRALQRLKDYEKERIHVITFGTAKIISDKSLASAKNYISNRDSITFIADPINAVKAKIFGSEHVEFVESTSLPFIDHIMNDKTYSKALSREGLKFKEKYLGAN